MKGATAIQERLWELRKDKGLNLEELAKLTKFQSQRLPAMNPMIIKKSIMETSSRWQIFMGYLSIICYAGQKTGNRPTRL